MFKLKSQKENYKSEAEKTWTSTKIKVRVRRSDFFFFLTLLTDHIPLVPFVVIEKTRQSVDNSVINNWLTIIMKNVSQRLTKRKIIDADKIKYSEVS